MKSKIAKYPLTIASDGRTSPEDFVCTDALSRFCKGGIKKHRYLLLELSKNKFPGSHEVALEWITGDVFIDRFRWFTYRPSKRERHCYGPGSRALFPDMTAALVKLGCVDKVFVKVSRVRKPKN